MVPPRAGPGQEQAGEVAVLGQPRLRPAAAAARGVGGHPPERLPRVVVRGRERVLRREAVLGRDREDAGLRGERVEVGVRERVGGGAHHVGAAVVVDDDGELLAGRGAGREEEARPDARGRVDDDVLGHDARGRVGAGRERGYIHEPLHAAAPVLADHGEEIRLHLRVRVLRRCRHRSFPASVRPRGAM